MRVFPWGSIIEKKSNISRIFILARHSGVAWERKKREEILRDKVSWARMAALKNPHPLLRWKTRLSRKKKRGREKRVAWLYLFQAEVDGEYILDVGEEFQPHCQEHPHSGGAKTEAQSWRIFFKTFFPLFTLLHHFSFLFLMNPLPVTAKTKKERGWGER